MDESIFFSEQQLRKRGAVKRLARCIIDIAVSVDKRWNNIVVLCIGTDLSTGDSFGPLTGYLLRACSTDCRVIGTIKEPVHALNLNDALKAIPETCTLVIAVDAAAGPQENIGGIAVDKRPLRPGSAVGHNLPPVGDVAVKGFVAEGGGLTLMSTSLGMVFCMAEVTAEALKLAARELNLVAAREAAAGSISV